MANSENMPDKKLFCLEKNIRFNTKGQAYIVHSVYLV